MLEENMQIKLVEVLIENVGMHHKLQNSTCSPEILWQITRSKPDALQAADP